MSSYLPPESELLENSQVVTVPLVESFRGIKQRTVLLFEGPSGWAEFAPFENHDLAHSAKWLEAAIEQAYGDWPAAPKQSVEVNAILPDVDLASTGEIAAQWIDKYGFSTFKFKSSADIGVDIAKAQLLSELVSASGHIPRIRMDANGRWDFSTAVRNLNRISAEVSSLEYVEQPLENLSEYLALKDSTSTPIALDESLRLSSEPDFELIHQVADVVVMKAIPLGGLARALEISKQLKMPIVVSGSLDTSIGLAAGLQLAALVSDRPAGLATDLLFTGAITSNPHQISQGQIAIGRRLPDLSSHYQATSEVLAEWRTRLSECYKYLEQQ
jgi:o-succinylbenzoate synthase